MPSPSHCGVSDGDVSAPLKESSMVIPLAKRPEVVDHYDDNQLQCLSAGCQAGGVILSARVCVDPWGQFNQ